MNLYQFVIRSFGAPQGYSTVQQMPVFKILVLVVVWLMCLSAIHTGFLYSSIAHFVKVTTLSLAADFPNDLQVVFQKGKMSLIGASTTQLIIRGTRTDVPVTLNPFQMSVDNVSIDAQIPRITLAQDAILFSALSGEEKVPYPDVDVVVTKQGVVAWAESMKGLLPWLTAIVFLFLFISNFIFATILSILFLFIVRVYTRYNAPLANYTQAYKIALYAIVPVLTVMTILYIALGSSSLILVTLVGILSLHYGLKK